jgi:hypothetical protein
VLDQGLLHAAISEFRNRLRPQNLTDEKVIDSLIWQTANLLSKGALVDGRIIYF